MPDIDRTIATNSQGTAGRNLFVDQDTTADEEAVGSPAKSGSVDQALGPTPDGDTTETAEESAAVDASRVEVTFRHALRSTRLLVPRDVPLGELLPEFLELAGVDGCGDAWVLATGDGAELPVANTLRECGVHDRDAVVLTRRGVAPPTPVPVPSRASRDSGSRGSKQRQAKVRGRRATGERHRKGGQ